MPHEWGLLIVLYLFLGGLSGGLLAIACATVLVGGDRLHAIGRLGGVLAPWPVIVGTALLVLDLGQPFYFWKLLVAFEPRSPMWIGTWLLTLFAVVGVAFANLSLPAAWRIWRPAAADTWRRAIAWAGTGLGIGVALYTGVLLGVLVARPLWNTPLLAQLFLASALSSSAALLLAAMPRRSAAERLILTRLDAALIAIELAVLGWFFIDAWTSTAGRHAAIGLLQRGAPGYVFWIAVVGVGLAIPLALDALDLLFHRLQRTSRILERAAAVAPLLVLVGGFLLRWVIVSAGQTSHL